VKALLLADLHFGVKKNSEEFQRIHLQLGDWILSVCKENGVDSIFFLGDMFQGHVRSFNEKALSIAVVDTATQFLHKLDGYSIYMIPGNHDVSYVKTSNKHALSPFSRWDNIKVFDKEIGYEKFDGKTCSFVPWGANIDEAKQTDMMFGHFDIKSFMMGKGMECEHGYTSTQLLEKSPLIFSGHFHIPQLKKFTDGKIRYLGSPLELNWGECGMPHYVYVLDFDNGKLSSVENTVSPRHIYLKPDDDFSMASGNYVRLSVDIENGEEYLKSIQTYSPLGVEVIGEKQSLTSLKEGFDETCFQDISIKDSIQKFIQELKLDNTKKELALESAMKLYEKFT
jgi:DNA repair exonuclease SbcCD nuclease subunit